MGTRCMHFEELALPLASEEADSEADADADAALALLLAEAELEISARETCIRFNFLKTSSNLGCCSCCNGAGLTSSRT